MHAFRRRSKRASNMNNEDYEDKRRRSVISLAECLVGDVKGLRREGRVSQGRAWLSRSRHEIPPVRK